MLVVQGLNPSFDLDGPNTERFYNDTAVAPQHCSGRQFDAAGESAYANVQENTLTIVNFNVTYDCADGSFTGLSAECCAAPGTPYTLSGCSVIEPSSTTPQLPFSAPSPLPAAKIVDEDEDVDVAPTPSPEPKQKHKKRPRPCKKKTIRVCMTAKKPFGGAETEVFVGACDSSDAKQKIYRKGAALKMKGKCLQVNRLRSSKHPDCYPLVLGTCDKTNEHQHFAKHAGNALNYYNKATRSSLDVFKSKAIYACPGSKRLFSLVQA